MNRDSGAAKGLESRAVRAALGFVVLCVGGCGASGGAASPREALSRFASAAQRGDAAALHAMLPARVRRVEDVGALRARLAGDRAELNALGRSIDAALAQGSGAQVEVALRGGGSVAVVEDTDGWRVADPGIASPAATTLEGVAGARAAVRALHVALRRHGPGAWARVLSARALGNVSAEVAALVEATEDPASLEYASQGSSVRFTLPDGRWLTVVYEGGAWRVDGVRDAE